MSTTTLLSWATSTSADVGLLEEGANQGMEGSAVCSGGDCAGWGAERAEDDTGGCAAGGDANQGMPADAAGGGADASSGFLAMCLVPHFGHLTFTPASVIFSSLIFSFAPHVQVRTI
jgi:hypothetical protein